MSRSKIPFFSIIIPCYNHGKYLYDCLYSVQQQSFLDWEAIIINDGSTDEIDSIGKKLANQDFRIHYISQTNQGLSAARNAGMKWAKADFLIFLDADDWLEPDCLSTYSVKTEDNPDINLFRCGYAYWDRPAGRNYHTHLPNNGSNEIWTQVLTQNIGPCHSILIRRSFAEKLSDLR